VDPTEALKLKALAFRALGSCLNGKPPALEDLDRAVVCLDLLGWDAAAEQARHARDACAADPEEARVQHSRVFHRSLPPPYETTYTANGSVNVLADIAGFYRAFGMEVDGEKADHIGAETEFIAYLAMKEAHALATNRDEHATVSREARATFLVEHAGSWLPLLEAQVERVSPGLTYRSLIRALHLALEADARDLGVALRPPSPYAGRPETMPGPAASPDRPYCESPDGDAPDW